MDFHLFIPINKIDVAQRLVFGTIAEEIPDKSDEIMDYETAKPEFEAWSAEIAKASNGRSVGNLRAMHGSVAAGKLDRIHFDDDAKRIATVAKVVDDSEWKKVLEGVYTGFSMGGRYVNRWPDPKDASLTRYTPRPMEVSLVDHPCIPSATFEVVKADGSVELRKFKPAERDVSRDALEFADPGYQQDHKNRYPLDTEAHIRAAWAYIHHAKNQKPYTADQIAKIKAKIVAAWKAKIDRNGPPLAAGKAASPLPLAKNLYDVSQLALIVDDLSRIAAGMDDAQPDADSLKSNLSNLVSLLNSLLGQATSGLVSGADNSDTNDAATTAPDDTGFADDDGDDDNDGGNIADFDADNDLANKKLGARRGEYESLRKAFTAIAPRIDAVSAQIVDLTKRLEHLEAQPLPGGPVAKFVTVTKAQDMAGRGGAVSPGDPLAQFQQHLESLPANERAHLLTKLALRNPIATR